MAMLVGYPERIIYPDSGVQNMLTVCIAEGVRDPPPPKKKVHWV